MLPPFYDKEYWAVPLMYHGYKSGTTFYTVLRVFGVRFAVFWK